jgi:ribonuclease P protein component
LSSIKPSIVILRGKGTFTRVIACGKRYEKKPIKLFLHTYESHRQRIAVGYAVGKGTGKAAQRNRFKRLMREAFRLNREKYLNHMVTGLSLEIIFLYTHTKDKPLKNDQFSLINQAIFTLGSTLKTIITNEQ